MRGRVARGRGYERGGVTTVLATQRLVRLPPQDGTRPSFHTLAPAGLIRDLDGVVQLSRGHGEGAGPQHGPPPELPLARPRLTREPPGRRPITTPLPRRCPIAERRSVTSRLSNRRVSLSEPLTAPHSSALATIPRPVPAVLHSHWLTRVIWVRYWSTGTPLGKSSHPPV